MTKRERIFALLAKGATTQEIMSHVGVSRGHVNAERARARGYVPPKIKARRQAAIQAEKIRIEDARRTPNIIRLTQGRVALIDTDDFEALIVMRWHAHYEHGKWYALSSPALKMHRVILAAPHGVLVDHINGDGLDNRRSNLRLCSSLENSLNKLGGAGRSGYRGVWENGDGWCAVLTTPGGRQYLGQFPTAEQAACAWDDAAFKERGQFSRLNFPERHRLPASLYSVRAYRPTGATPGYSKDAA